MGVRIILVSVVAGLGLTLPSVNQVGEWRSAAQAWVNERLAEWDAQMPLDENAFVIVPEPPVVEAAAPAIQKVESTETKTETAESIAPIVVPQDEPIAGLVAPTRPMDLDESDPASAPAGDPAPAPTPSVQSGDSGFVAAQDEFVACYEIEVASAETIRNADDPESLFPALASEWNRAAEAVESSPSIAPTETAEVVEDLYEGLAYELNRGAEGVEPMPIVSARPVEKATLTEREGRLTTAVRLTREAVHAWANLLHGPAVVTISD